MSNNWKYGLIKVAIEDEGTDYEAQINLLVELYPLGDNGEYDSFCLARLQSIEEIQNAQKDIEHDGINEWFYDNGVFEWKVCNNCTQGDWDWIRSKRGEEKEKHSPDCKWHKDWHACNCGMFDNTGMREEDILDDEDERLYDRLIKEIMDDLSLHAKSLDWDEDRMRARLRKVLETT